MNKAKAKVAWFNLLRRVKLQSEYSHVKVKLTREEFYQWYIDNWPSGMEHPSVDRINNEGHYELSNMQFLEWRENSKKTRRNKNINAPPGFHWCRDCQAYIPEFLFGKSQNEYKGFDKLCRDHRRIRNHTSYHKHIEKRRAYDRIRKSRK